MPSGPPRKIEVEAVNSSSVKVLWRSPVPNRQHGQIRGYQVNYVRMVNGEPVGHPVIKDILIDDAQVGTHLHSCTASQVNRYRLWRVLWLWHSSYSQLPTLSIVCVCVCQEPKRTVAERALCWCFFYLHLAFSAAIQMWILGHFRKLVSSGGFTNQVKVPLPFKKCGASRVKVLLE